MAAMTLEPRDPEMSHFIDQYKFERQMAERRDKFGGGTSLPLNSDGYEDRQRFLKEERHKEWAEHQEKDIGYKPTINPYPHPKLSRGPQNRTSYDIEIQKMTDRYHNRYDDVLVRGDEQDPVYYRIGTPERGLPIGNYEQQRHEINLERHRDYNKMMKKQRKIEQDRIEQRRRNRPPPAQPQTNQIDYNEARDLANTEDKKAYQDYQGKFTIPIEGRAHIKPPISYEENRKVLAEERKHEYALYQEKKAKEERYRAMRGRPITPPGGGLDVGQYDRQVKEMKAQKTKEYRDMLDQQASETLKHRYYERLADTSPNYIKYRDDERPLVGSPRDINPALFEKESRNIYEKDVINKSTQRKPQQPPKPAAKSPEDPYVKDFLEIERQKIQERKQYGEDLRKQQKEQMLMKAQRDTEMSVIDRQRMSDSQYVASKPPAGPAYKPRDEPIRQPPGFWNEGRRAPSPKSVHSEAYRRQRDDGVPLAFQTNTHARPRSRGTDQSYIPSLSDAPVRGQFYDERSRPPFSELLPPNSPRRRTPPPRTPPPRRREFEDESDQFRIQPRPPRRSSPPPRTPVGSEQFRNQNRSPRRRTPPQRPPPASDAGQSDKNSSHMSTTDLSPRRRKALEMDESQYDKMRKTANIARQEDYKIYLKEKEEDCRRQLSNRTVTKPAAVVKGPYYSSDNYETYQAELRRKQIDDYKDYLQKNYQPPPGAEGLPLEQSRYEPKRLAMEAERNVEYNELIQKGSKEQEKVTGPQGLPLDPKLSVEKAKWLEKQRNREYNEFLMKEQEARHISSYLDIPNPFLPPPPHHPRIPEPYQTNTHIYKQSMKAPYPKAASAPAQTDIPGTPNKLSLPVGQYDDIRPFLVKRRNKDYNNYKEQLPPLRPPKMTPDATAIAVSLPIGEYDETRKMIGKQRADEYNKTLLADKIAEKSPREKAHTPPQLQGLPIGQHHYDPLHRAMEYQRNREYNEFINKKLGQRKAKSEPERNKASFYLGNDFIHAEKRRFLEAERQKEYNDLVRQRPPPPSKEIEITSDEDSGLPIGQQHHEAWRKFLRDQRNKEYNQLVEKTRPAPKNRGWKESDSGLLLPEDHSMEYKKRELQNERKQEYQEHLKQKKAPPNHFWPEPEPGRGALWLKKGEYDGVRQMYDEERKKEFVHNLEKKQQQQEISQSPRPKSEPPNTTKNGYINPMVESMGRYEILRQKLRDIRRKDFVDFIDKAKPHWSERRYGDQPPSLARDEKPLVYSMGRYDLEQLKKVREEAHNDLAKYYEEQRKTMSPRRFEKELPQLATAEDPFVNYMGNYEKEREKYAIERHKDFCDFSEKYKQQHHSPWKNYVYPLNAHLEHPVIEKMGHEVDEKKRLLRAERKRDYERYLSEQRKTEVPRRDDYGRNVAGPYNGMFHGLGEHGGNKDELSQQRRQEYNDRLDQQYSQRDKPTGRPSWAKDPVTDQQDFGDRGRSPLKSPTKQDHYEQMLHEKRREEAQRRRYDDPEYQEKLARVDLRERGPARDQPRYGY